MGDVPTEPGLYRWTGEDGDEHLVRTVRKTHPCHVDMPDALWGAFLEPVGSLLVNEMSGQWGARIPDSETLGAMREVIIATRDRDRAMSKGPPGTIHLSEIREADARIQEGLEALAGQPWLRTQEKPHE